MKFPDGPSGGGVYPSGYTGTTGSIFSNPGKGSALERGILFHRKGTLWCCRWCLATVEAVVTATDDPFPDDPGASATAAPSAGRTRFRFSIKKKKGLIDRLMIEGERRARAAARPRPKGDGWEADCREERDRFQLLKSHLMIHENRSCFHDFR